MDSSGHASQLREWIPNPGLQFGVLNALLSNGQLSTYALDRALKRAVEAIEIENYGDVDDDGVRCLEPDEADEILSAARVGFGEVEVTRAQLETIETLHFDGGNEIYMFFEGRTEELLGVEDELDTGGESPIYNVDSFEGIEALANLKTLNLDGHGYSERERDATPLGALAKLERITALGSRVSNRDAIANVASVS